MHKLLRIIAICTIVTLVSLAFPLALFAQHAYLTCRRASTVDVYNLTNGDYIGDIRVGDFPTGVASTPDGAHVYVTNTGSSTVSVIDTSSNTVVATINVGYDPYGVAINPTTTSPFLPPEAYVTNLYGYVSVIDTSSNTVIH